MPLVSISEISSLYLASVAAQAGLSLPWSQTTKTGFLVMWLRLRWSLVSMFSNNEEIVLLPFLARLNNVHGELLYYPGH